MIFSSSCCDSWHNANGKKARFLYHFSAFISGSIERKLKIKSEIAQTYVRETRRINCWLMLPLRESTWRSLRATVPAPLPSRAAVLKGELPVPLFCGPDLPKVITASCSLLALVRSAENCSVLDYFLNIWRLISIHKIETFHTHSIDFN